MHASNCANCGAPLVGPYCAQCGQHAHESSRTMGVLFHDAWHVVTHLDGRFWQTMRALALKPGLLTREYFAERRARYVPPVRLYLVLSVLFFALAASGPRHVGTIDAKLGATDDAELKQVQGEVEQARRELAKALTGAAAPGATPAAAPPAAPSVPASTAASTARPSAPAAAASPPTDEDDAEPAGTAAPPAGGKRQHGLLFKDRAECQRINVGIKWLEQPARDACERNAADHGQTFFHAFAASLPKMMFVFLPLMALVMMLLYWFPRRYYVEHVVFFLHTHAAVFLALIVSSILSLLAHWWKWLGPVSVAFGFFVFFYVIWYVYRAMRVYYGQGRWLTLGKMTVIGFTYFVFLGITMLLTLAAVFLLA